MSVIRINKTKNYTVLSNYHFKEKEMSLKAKGLLSLMLSLPDDWNYSISGLVKLSKDGKDSVMSALSELEKFGYLMRVRLQNEKGQFNGVEYNIYEEPQRDFPVADNQKADKKKAVKQDADKPRQLNTIPLSTKENKDLKELNTQEDFNFVLAHINDIHLISLYKDYIKMREDIGAPLTESTLRVLIDRCERISGYNPRIQKLLLETAIINNWKNVYLPKEDGFKGLNEQSIQELKSLYGIE